MLTIYGDIYSGNCYKIKLVLAHRNITHRWVHVDILKDETELPAFLEMNPNGKIPVLDLGDGRYLWESNAILNYLAAGSDLLPVEPFAHAKVLQWQFFEQYSHEPYIAVARYIARYLGLPEHERARYEACHPKGYKALNVMEQQLLQTAYLAGDSFTIADISLYAYTHVAAEGGFDLSPYAGINRWIKAIEQHRSHVTMEEFAPSRS